MNRSFKCALFLFCLSYSGMMLALEQADFFHPWNKKIESMSRAFACLNTGESNKQALQNCLLAKSTKHLDLIAGSAKELTMLQQKNTEISLCQAIESVQLSHPKKYPYAKDKLKDLYFQKIEEINSRICSNAALLSNSKSNTISLQSLIQNHPCNASENSWRYRSEVTDLVAKIEPKQSREEIYRRLFVDRNNNEPFFMPEVLTQIEKLEAENCRNIRTGDFFFVLNSGIMEAVYIERPEVLDGKRGQSKEISGGTNRELNPTRTYTAKSK